MSTEQDQKLKSPGEEYFVRQPSWAHQHGVSHEQLQAMRSALQEQKK
jgi:hypothetical protein